MPPRPSTSGGTRAPPPSFDSLNGRRISRDDMFLKHSNRPPVDYNKRMSRDDMFMGPRQPPQIWKPALSVMPRFGQAPAPAPAPDFSSGAPSPATIAVGSVPRRRETLESLRSAEIPIGMAIGSPTHIPSALSTAWLPQAPAQVPEPATGPELSRQSTDTAGLKRSKTGRRKIFGIFGRRNTADHVKDPQPTEVRTESRSSTSTGTTTTTTTISRSTTSAGGKGSKQDRPPGITRTNTEPFRPKTAANPPTMPVISGPLELEWQQRQRPREISSPFNQNSGAAASSAFTSSKSPFLDVEIPSIKMERYSVMFGSLLDARRNSALLTRRQALNERQASNGQQASSAQQNASGQLALNGQQQTSGERKVSSGWRASHQRQATIEKLNAISERVLKEEEAKRRGQFPRRATSPQTVVESPVITSPAFALFPSTPHPRPEHLPAPPVSPRMRSNTSPAMLPSPSTRLSFGDDAMPRGPDIQIDVRSQGPVEAASSNRASPASHPAHANHKVVYFEQNQSNLVLDSPSTIDEFEDDYPPRPLPGALKPHLAEPHWQMVTPPASAATSSTSASSGSGGGVARKRSPSSASSVRTHITKPSLDIEESDSALKAAVEISIARQISVSRQQRHLLRPLHTGPNSVRQGAAAGAAKSPSPRSAASGSSSGSPVKLGKNERLYDTKASTPTLIHPPQDPSSEFLAHRKSSRVVLEAA